MTHSVVTGETTATLAELARLMRDRNVGSVVVVDGDRPVGVVTDRDLAQHRIRRLPVMSGEQLAGIVTIDDLAVRAGDLALAQQMTAEVAKAALPEFYFHQRGG